MQFIFEKLENNHAQLRLEGGEVVELNPERFEEFVWLMDWSELDIELKNNEIIETIDNDIIMLIDDVKAEAKQ